MGLGGLAVFISLGFNAEGPARKAQLPVKKQKACFHTLKAVDREPIF